MSLINIFLLGNSSDKEPEKDHNDGSLPDRSRDHIPHLIIKHMNFLESLQVVLS